MGFLADWLQQRREMRKAKQSAKTAFVELRGKHPGNVLIHATTRDAYIVNVLYGSTCPPGLSQWSVSRITFCATELGAKNPYAPEAWR
jgi:hypothetical protein